jgi:oxygen-dependent protoporphyrinogen oxidase
MSKTCDVAIIGAGLSGMTAAYQLRDLDAVVLEADAQIGGRSQRVELAGRPTTQGGEGWYVSNPDSVESKLLIEAGIESTKVRGPAMLHADGHIIGLSAPNKLAKDLGLSVEAHPDFVRTFERVRETSAALARNPVDEGLLRELLTVGAVEWLGPVHDEVLAIYRRLAAVEMGISLETSSAFLLFYGMPPFGGASVVWMEFMVPHGGAAIIPVTMAAALQRAPVTGAVVTAIEQNASWSTITYRHQGEKKALDAEFVAVATPPAVAAEIVLGLPTEKLAAMKTITVEPTVEVLLLIADDGPAPWHEISAMWAIDKAFSVCIHSRADDVDDLSDDGTPQPSVIKLISTGTYAALLADRSDDFVVEAFQKDFEDMFPEARGKVQAHSIKRWMHGVPLPTRGFEQHVAEMLRPVGNVHFAGDWCAFVDPDNPGGVGVEGDWGDYSITVGLNAAVRSGMRAASEVRARVGAAVR